MEVARTFQDAGFVVTLSDYVQDEGRGEPREIDVIANYTCSLSSIRSFDLTFVGECKYSRDKPWVVFKSSANDDISRMAEFLFRFGTRGGHDALMEMSSVAGDRATLFRLPASLGHGVTRAFETKSDLAYTSVTKVCDGAAALVAEREKETNAYVVMFPVIFLQGEIFECAIDDGMAIKLTEVDRATVLWRRPTPQSSLVPVEIVTERAIPSFAAEKFQQCQVANDIIMHELPNTRDAALTAIAAQML